MLTVTLNGFAAVHYARATGATLRRSEIRRAHGHVEPARVVAIDESMRLLQRDQTEAQFIGCIATHGERPYHGAGPIEIDWPAVHAAAMVVDAERGDLGYENPIDAFGGSYFPPNYEADALAGVVRVLNAAQMIRTAAWNAVHRAGQARDRQLAARGLRTALALDHLFCALATIGVYRYEPGSQICGVTGYGDADTVQVTGLRWLRGERVEPDASPTIAEVMRLLAEVAERG